MRTWRCRGALPTATYCDFQEISQSSCQLFLRPRRCGGLGQNAECAPTKKIPHMALSAAQHGIFRPGASRREYIANKRLQSLDAPVLMLPEGGWGFADPDAA